MHAADSMSQDTSAQPGTERAFELLLEYLRLQRGFGFIGYKRAGLAGRVSCAQLLDAKTELQGIILVTEERQPVGGGV